MNKESSEGKKKIKVNKYGDVIDDSDPNDNWSFVDPSTIVDEKNFDDAIHIPVNPDEITGDRKFSENPNPGENNTIDIKSPENAESVNKAIKKYLDKIKNYDLSSMEIALGCGFVGILNAINGGVIGGLVGSLQGLTQGAAMGLGNPNLFKAYKDYVYQNMKLRAIDFSLFMGVYSGSMCTVKLVRKQEDSFNAFIAGGVTGMASSLKTRDPRRIIASGVLGAVVMSIFDLFSKH